MIIDTLYPSMTSKNANIVVDSGSKLPGCVSGVVGTTSCGCVLFRSHVRLRCPLN